MSSSALFSNLTVWVYLGIFLSFVRSGLQSLV